MPTTASFTGSAFSLQSAAYVASPPKVRVRFTNDPNQSNPAGPNDGLNPRQYALAGTAGPPAISSVAIVSGDTQSLDLLLAGPLAAGAWVVTASSSVQTPEGVPLSAPLSQQFQVAQGTNQGIPPAQGSFDDDEEAFLRKHVTPANGGKFVDSVLAGLAQGTSDVHQVASSAFDQLYVATASAPYVDRLLADQDIVRPDQVWMSDNLYRKLGISLIADRVTASAERTVLEIFYGEEATRASITSAAAEPYALANGQQLQLLVDEKIQAAVTFSAPDFGSIGSASAQEVAFSISRQLRAQGIKAYAIVWQNPSTGLNQVRIYSPSLGLAGGVRANGGQAQNALQFPSLLPTFAGAGGVQTGQAWTLSVPRLGTLKLFLSAASATDLSKVQVGDYLNAYGAGLSAGNKGSFPVTAVDVRYVSGTLTQYVTVSNPSAAPQAFTPAASSDLMFFRPVRGQINGGQLAAVVEPGPEGAVDVLLPATSVAVNRTAGQGGAICSGAYLQGRTPLAISSVTRIGSSVTASTSAPHGLSPGQWIVLDGAWGSGAKPANAGGDATHTSYNPVTAWSSLTAFGGTSVLGAKAAALSGGSVLVCGGRNASDVAPTQAFLFTVTGSAAQAGGGIQYAYSQASAASLPAGKAFHSVIGLVDASQGGNAIALGGYDPNSNATFFSSYVYSASGNSWSANISMSAARARPAAALLATGQVLATGGSNGDGSTLASCEIFTPSLAGGAWAAAASMITPRACHHAVTLSTGKVLAFGGTTIPSGAGSLKNALEPDSAPSNVLPIYLCEVYDPIGNSWSATGSMTFARAWFAAVNLPNDQVLAVGGIGYNVTQGGANAQLLSAEIWDSATGRWEVVDPLPAAAAPLSSDGSLSAFWMPLVGKAFVCTPTDGWWFDPNSRKWTHAANQQPTQRKAYASALLADGTLLSFEGYDVNSLSLSGVSALFMPNSDVVSAGGLDGIWQLTAASGTSLSWTSVTSGYAAGASPSPQATPATALPSTYWPGPYLWDPNAGLGIGGTSTTTSMALSAGHQYATLPVASAAAFPNAPGWLAIGLGTKAQSGPVPYLGVQDSGDLILDFSFVFPVSVPSGADVTLLSGKAPFVPSSPQTAGSLYLTPSSSGRVAAEQFAQGAIAGGVQSSFTVEYPGDRGLGNEGYPDDGQPKLSDAVEVWAGDEVDSEVAGLRAL